MELLGLPARLRWFAAFAGLWLGCAHLPAPPPPDAPVWPKPPAAPLVRWAGTFPDERFEPAGPSVFRKVLNFIVGLDSSRPDEAVLMRPFGVAALEQGFAVADPDARAVLRVDWRQGRYVSVVCADHPWQMPMAIAAGPAGELYVADGGAAVVVRVDLDGHCRLIGEGAFERPIGVAFAGGLLYVVDTPRHRVISFTPDGHEHSRFGVRGSEAEGLNFPTGIAAAPDGSLLVVDALNFRVVRMSVEGELLEEFGGAGDGEGAFGRPKGVATDFSGRFFVTDASHDIVVVFSSTGLFVLALGGTGQRPGELLLPAGVAVGGGYLYVANSYNHRIEIFQLVGGEPP